MGVDIHARELVKGIGIRRDDPSPRCSRRRGNNQVVRSPRTARNLCRRKQLRVFTRDGKVKRDYWDRRDNIIDERLPLRAVLVRSELNTDQHLRHGYRGNGHVIFIIDHNIQVEPVSLSVDQESGVE